MNEAETRADHIDPALKAAGWGVVEGSRIRHRISALGMLRKPLLHQALSEEFLRTSIYYGYRVGCKRRVP